MTFTNVEQNITIINPNNPISKMYKNPNPSTILTTSNVILPYSSNCGLYPFVIPVNIDLTNSNGTNIEANNIIFLSIITSSVKKSNNQIN